MTKFIRVLRVQKCMQSCKSIGTAVLPKKSRMNYYCTGNGSYLMGVLDTVNTLIRLNHRIQKRYLKIFSERPRSFEDLV